jgi:pSer/pThr/pTyr-binding forkhead associated (FHA) protein
MAYDPALVRATLETGKATPLPESAQPAFEWLEEPDTPLDPDDLAPPAPPPSAEPPAAPPPAREEIAARCLLSSVLADPIRLEEGTFYRIGRDKTSDICFPSTHVSRTHAELTFEKGTWVVGDLGSKNGTLVNGERVFKRILKNGDRIEIGHFEVHYKELTKSELETLRGKKSGKLGDTLKISQDEIGFFGDVKRLSVLEVVQLLGQNRKTGVLVIREEKKGAPERRLSLVDGAIVHAEFGSLEGERAVQPILKTRTGKFAFKPSADAGGKVTIQTPTPTLLLQAMEAPRGA